MSAASASARPPYRAGVLCSRAIFHRPASSTATSACTEGGDSGGANIAGRQAQAVTSGGAGYDDDGNPSTPAVCGEKVGQANVSYVQPVNEILQQYNLTISTAG